jgi:DNA-directed RNA polymerase II subunit RPB2
MEQLTWEVIYAYFREHPDWIAKHQIESYNDFITNKIPQIFNVYNTTERTPIIIFDKNEESGLKYIFDVYLAGKNGKKYKLALPTIYDHIKQKMRPMTPNEARLKDLTYGLDIFMDFDIDVSCVNNITGEVLLDKVQLPNTSFLKSIYIGNIPLMLKSNLCILNGLQPNALIEFGESEYETGGYFIMDGGEKIMIGLQRKAENRLFLNKLSESASNKYRFSADIKSVNLGTLSTARNNVVLLDKHGFVTVLIGPQAKPFIQLTEDNRYVPLFVIFRLLGIETDKQILELICGDLNDDLGRKLADLLRPSILDPIILENNIYDRQTAEVYLEPLTSRSKTNQQGLQEIRKRKVNRLSFLYDTVYENILPHIGNDLRQKAYYLAHMTRELLLLSIDLREVTNKDVYFNKRLDTAGSLLTAQFKMSVFKGIGYNISRQIRSKYELQGGSEYSRENIVYLINETNYTEIFNSKPFTEYFTDYLRIGKIGRKAGVLQQGERINFYNFSAHLRRIVDPVDPGDAQDGQRRLNNTHFGYICTQESPEGAKIGLTTHLSMIGSVTTEFPDYQIKELCYKYGTLPIRDLAINQLHNNCKIIVNGAWIGCHSYPYKFVKLFRLMRRNGLINATCSICWETIKNEIHIFTDGGRLIRPLYIMENNELLIDEKTINMLKEDKIKWTSLLYSKLPRKDGKEFKVNDFMTYKPELLGIKSDDENLMDILNENKAVIEYVDIHEMDTCLLASKYNYEANELLKYTHKDFHQSVMLGLMGQVGPLLHHGQASKYLASGASKHPKQSVNVYSSNFMDRIDTSAHLGHHSERPLLHTNTNEIIYHNRQPTGNNIIVAIGMYNGYNQEDSIIANSNSIDMGLFNSSYYKQYKDHELTDDKTGMREVFYNPIYTEEFEEYPEELAGGHGEYTYEHLDKFGFIKEGTPLTGNEILIGKFLESKAGDGTTTYGDMSTHVKKHMHNSYVDKVYTCRSNANGMRLCKIRTCQFRKPQCGDKLASRCGQKGTIGIMMKKEDMPYTTDGLTPDLIIHPTAYPKRMTLNQLLELLYGSLASKTGAFQIGNTLEYFDINEINNILTEKLGFQEYGDRILYNGVYGEQMKHKIFIGPIYYQRLKLMVNDKINYRAEGQRQDGVVIPGGGYSAKERQVVQGRAAGGGIKIGEMERDSLIAHGAASVINDRDIVRGDRYYIYVSPVTGEMMIGNPHEKIYFDPLIDGPVSYHLDHDYDGSVDKYVGLNTYNKTQNSYIRIQIPYTTKLIIQDLHGMGISLRLRPNILKLVISKSRTGQDIKDLDLQFNDLIGENEEDIQALLKERFNSFNNNEQNEINTEFTPKDEQERLDSLLMPADSSKNPINIHANKINEMTETMEGKTGVENRKNNIDMTQKYVGLGELPRPEDVQMLNTKTADTLLFDPTNKEMTGGAEQPSQSSQLPEDIQQTQMTGGASIEGLNVQSPSFNTTNNSESETTIADVNMSGGGDEEELDVSSLAAEMGIEHQIGGSELSLEHANSFLPVNTNFREESNSSLVGGGSIDILDNNHTQSINNLDMADVGSPIYEKKININM